MTEYNPLYRKWYTLKNRDHVKEWDDFAVFQEWCWASGYAPGRILVKKFRGSPYGPDNCVWASNSKTLQEDSVRAETVRKWNKTVNRIRKVAGLELFPE